MTDEYIVEGSVPAYLWTHRLEDDARREMHPERFIILLSVSAAEREAVQAEALGLMFRHGGSYVETLRGVVHRHIHPDNNKHRGE